MASSGMPLFGYLSAKFASPLKVFAFKFLGLNIWAFANCFERERELLWEAFSAYSVIQLQLSNKAALIEQPKMSL